MSFNVLNRKIHYWASAIVAIPLLVIICSGLLLQAKKQSSWVQPPVRQVSEVHGSVSSVQKLPSSTVRTRQPSGAAPISPGAQTASAHSSEAGHCSGCGTRTQAWSTQLSEVHDAPSSHSASAMQQPVIGRPEQMPATQRGGAAAVYLYVTQGPLVEATFGTALSWRDGAKTSVHGYGGTGQSKR